MRTGWQCATREPVMFAAMTFLLLVPVLILTPFVTLDGAAHLYNAVLLDGLLSGNAPESAQVYVFNPFPEPNWTGHAVMVIFLQVLSPLLAEKLLQLLVLVCMAYGFRSLVRSLDPARTPWLSWFVFPLLYNFPFLLGFYNFSLGVALLLPGVSWWIRKQEIQLSNRQWIVVCCWAGLLYFSHIVVFLLGIGLAGLVTLFRNDQRTLKVKAALVFRLLLALLPWLVLTATYLLKSGNAGFRGGVVYLPLEELFSDLCKARMLIAYEEQQESLFTGLYAQFVLLMLMLAFLKRSVAVFARVGILNFIVACLLYGLMPDSVAGGGILSVRLLLWLYVSALILLVALRLPDRYARSGAWISLATSLLLAYIHAPIQVHLNRDAKAFIAAAGSIPYHGCVLPLNYSGNWMHSNFPSYLGACSGALVWDNYEANEGVFPLQWKQGMNPELHLGNHVSSSRPCVDIAASNRVTGLPLTHVLIWKRRDVPPDSCSMDVQHQLDAGFTRIRSEDPMVFSSITNSGKQ